MDNKNLEKMVYDCLNSFPNNVNFHSDYCKVVIAKAIVKTLEGEIK